MARIKFDNGQTVEFDGTPTPQDVEEVAMSLGIGKQIQTESKPQSMPSKIWDVLKVPEEKSREGLKMLSGLAKNIPDAKTSSVGTNVALNLPKFALETGLETASRVAPGYVSPLSLVASGTQVIGKGASMIPPIARAAKSAGKFIAKGAEEISGLTYKTPGVLGETFRDPSLFFANNLEKARELYAKATGLAPKIREEIKLAMTKDDQVSKAWQAVKDGTITGDEALEARKTLDSIKKSIPQTTFRTLRQAFDQVAKTKFGSADLAFQRAIKAENMRRLLPINKGGTPSLAKGAAMSFMPKLGFIAPPAVQGLTAAGLGTIAKASPLAGSKVVGSTQAILDAIFGNR